VSWAKAPAAKATTIAMDFMIVACVARSECMSVASAITMQTVGISYVFRSSTTVGSGLQTRIPGGDVRRRKWAKLECGKQIMSNPLTQWADRTPASCVNASGVMQGDPVYTWPLFKLLACRVRQSSRRGMHPIGLLTCQATRLTGAKLCWYEVAVPAPQRRSGFVETPLFSRGW